MKVDEIGLDVAQTWNAAAMVLNNNIVNENGLPITFVRHKFLAQPYMDDTPEQVVRKAGQVGWSTLAIIRAFHLAKYKKANIAYTLPSKSVVSDFVSPKVDPLISNNPFVAKSIGRTDSKALKSIQTDEGERFIYFRGCFDEQTQILTTEGWKQYQDIKPGDTILNVNMETEKIEVNQIEKVLTYDVNEELYRFSGNVDFLVTGEHRMVIRKYRGAGLSYVRAKDLKQNHKRVIPLRFNPYDSPKAEGDEAFWELVGWVIGDGSYWTEKYRSRFVRQDGTINPKIYHCPHVVLIQKKKKNELRRWLNENGFTHYQKDKKNGCVGFELNRTISRRIVAACPGKKLTQRLVLSLSHTQRLALFQGLIKSDGVSGERERWYQSDKSESEAFQLLCFLIGKNAWVTTRRNKGGFKKESVDYPVNVRTSKNAEVFNPERKHYKGRVWCVTTENGTVITRRNGTISVSGNSWEPESAISISIHVLINDEVDRSNPRTLETFRTRLDAAKLDRPDLGYVWMFSNPSHPGRGVDEGYQKSDQKHWMIKCSRCNKFQHLDWPDNIDVERKIYICKYCKRPLSEDDRLTGNWVQKKFGRDISGYWITQLMAPWFSAKDIIKKSQQDPSIFHNFVLGKAYVSKEDAVTREVIARCCYPDRNPQINVAMGVDVGVTKHYVIGNEYGIFRIGETDSWDEIENLRNFYNATMVCDANPHPTPVKKLIKKYPGKVWMCYYRDTKDTRIVQWGEKDKYGTVYADRTKIIDSIVADFRSKDLLFNMTLNELDNADYIPHWTNMYRTVEENDRGMQKVVWRHDEHKPDHLCFSKGTLITTLRGDVPIDAVTTNDYALTRSGFRKVVWSGPTQEARVCHYRFSDGNQLTATPDHPIWLDGKGFVALHATNYGDKIMRCNHLKRLYFKVLHIIGIQTQNGGVIGFITLQTERLLIKASEDFIKKFGWLVSGLYQKVMLFITATATPSTMKLAILSAYPDQNIKASTQKKDLTIPSIGRKTDNILKGLENYLMPGEAQKKVKIGTLNTPIKSWCYKNLASLFVSSAARRVKQLVGRVVNIARGDVVVATTQEGGGEETVYNLEVEGEHEYYANGILVSNCHATCYFKMALQKTMVAGEVVTSTPPGQEEQPITIKPGNKMDHDMDLEAMVDESDSPSRDWKNI